MEGKVASPFESCPECNKEFRHIESVNPRKGYDVLWEDAHKWEIRCKGCDTPLRVHREEHDR